MNIQDILMMLDSSGFTVMSTLLSLLWQSSILFAVAGALAFFLRRKKETICHAVWLAALLALPLLPLLSGGAPEFGAPKAHLDVIPTYAEPWKAPAQPSLPIQSPVAVQSQRAAATSEPLNLPSSMEAGPSPAQAAPVIPERRIVFTDYPWALALLAYLLVVGGFLGGMLLMRIRIHSWVVRGTAVDCPRTMEAFHTAIQLLGIDREYMVIEHPGIPAPLTCRILRPVVILPPGFAEGLSDSELRAVALHELAHIKRRDTLVFTGIAFLRAFFFFQPLVWYAARQVSFLAEVACDSAALEHEGNPASYANLLTRIAVRLPDRAPAAELAAGILFTNSSFFRRVREILSDRNSRFIQLSRRTLMAISTLGVLAFLAAAALPLAERDSGDTITVSGVALFKGKPMEGAEIYLSDPKSETVEKRTVSDSQGEFSFRVNRSELSGEYWRQPAVLAYKPGLPLGWMQFTRGVDLRSVVIEPEEGKPITGVVRDSRGNPVPNAEVTAYNISYFQYGVSNSFSIAGKPFPPLTVVTGSDGSFTLQGFPEGASANMEAKANGFGPDYKAYGRGSNPGRVIFSLPPESRISGRVTSGETGKPVSNIRIRAFNMSISPGGREAVTDREGRYTVENLPAGVYGMLLFPRDESGEWTAASRKDVMVKPGETTGGVDFTLVKGGEITGAVLDRDTGEPISDHWVGLKDNALPDRFHCTRCAITDREGKFRFRAVLGSMRVVSSAPLGREYSDPVAREVEIAEGKTVAVEPFRFGKGITLHGMVRTLDGKPRSGVHLYGKGAGTIWARSDAEGKFAISGLKQGEKISLKAFNEDRRLRGVVNLEATTDAGVDILLREYEIASRAGRIIDGEGKPVSGAKVQVIWWTSDENAGYTYDTVYTDDAGGYAFNGLIVGDTYGFSVEAAGYVSPGMTRGDEFVVKSGMPPYKDIALIKADRWLEVHVESPSGKPVPEAWVQCGNTNHSMKRTDFNGDVRFDDIAETLVNFIIITHDDFGRFEFRYAPTNTRNTYRLIRADKYLSGTVVDSAGKPVKGAIVGVEPYQFNSGLVTYGVQTPEDGSFRFNNMIQDTVKVTVSHNDYTYKTLDGVRTNQKGLVITLEPRTVTPIANTAKSPGAGKDTYTLAPIPRQSRIAVDGNLSDWGSLPAEKVELLAASALSNENAQTQNPPSKDELSALLRCGSDGDFLYLAVDVRDDDSDFETAAFDYLHLQDCVEILFSNGKSAGEGGKLQVTLDSKGNLILSGRDPITNEKYPYFWESVGVRAALTRNSHGYSVEAAIPWSVFELSGWETGNGMGLNVRVYDFDSKRPARYLVEWSSEDGAEYKKLLGARPKASKAAFRSRDLDKIQAALTAMQKKDWTLAENLLRKSGNTPWGESLLAQTLFTSGRGTEGAEIRKRMLRENRSPAIRDWGMNTLYLTSSSLEGKGKYREAIAVLEGLDFSGPKTYIVIYTMLKLVQCYCLNNEYAKAEPLLKQIMGSASEKQIYEIEGLISSARQMQASVERMKMTK